MLTSWSGRSVLTGRCSLSRKRIPWDMKADNPPVPRLRYEWTSPSIMVWFLGATDVCGEPSPPKRVIEPALRFIHFQSSSKSIPALCLSSAACAWLVCQVSEHVSPKRCSYSCGSPFRAIRAHRCSDTPHDFGKFTGQDEGALCGNEALNGHIGVLSTHPTPSPPPCPRNDMLTGLKQKQGTLCLPLSHSLRLFFLPCAQIRGVACSVKSGPWSGGKAGRALSSCRIPTLRIVAPRLASPGANLAGQGWRWRCLDRLVRRWLWPIR